MVGWFQIARRLNAPQSLQLPIVSKSHASAAHTVQRKNISLFELVFLDSTETQYGATQRSLLLCAVQFTSELPKPLCSDRDHYTVRYHCNILY
jgi:hypothetical protein